MSEHLHVLPDREQTNVDRERTLSFLNAQPEVFGIRSNDDPDEIFITVPSYEVRMTFLGNKRVDIAFWEDEYLKPMANSIRSVGKRLQPQSVLLANVVRRLCLFLVRDLGCRIVAEASDLRRYEVYTALSVRYNIPVELILGRWDEKKLRIKERYGRRNHNK